MKNILLTGASGFIGNAFLKKLININLNLNEEYQIYYIKRPSTEISIEGATPLNLEENSFEGFKFALKDKKFDYIYNFASYGVNRKDQNINEILDGNIIFLINLLRSISHTPKLFINIGSCAEYGKIDFGIEAEEDYALRPQSIYASAKASSFYFGKNIAKENNIPFIHLRLFGIYGIGEHDKRLIPYVIKSLNANKEVLLTSGTQVRDWLYIDDLTDALHLILNCDPSKISQENVYNICSGEGISVKDVINIIVEKLKVRSELLKWNAIKRVDEHNWIVGSSRKFTMLTGWNPKININNGIKQFINYYKIEN